MRFVANGLLRRSLATVVLLAGSAGGASAQLLFDANLLWENNPTLTLAAQFNGTAPAGAIPPCPAGYNALTLGTVTYTNNRYLDPLLTGGVYPSNNFRPTLGSPAYGYSATVPADGFFVQKCFQGAIGPNPGDDWTENWTYYNENGAGRQDLHLVTMPDPRPLAIYQNISLLSSQFWGPDSNYLVRGQLRVKDQAFLAIAPGVVVFEDEGTLGTIIVERGGRINAVGTACDPIIITSSAAPGSQARGQCGGLTMLGRAKTNIVNSCIGDSSASEGGAIGFFGGNDDDDDSGILRYVRVEYAGKEITTNNELNSFTWNACGRRTQGDFLEAFRGADDGFEWFGGTMNQKHLIAIDGSDDGYDTQLGTRNKAQFVVVRVSAEQSPSLTQFGERGIEADNNEFNNDQVQCSGRANTVISNATFIGDKRTGPTFPGSTQGAQWRRGTGFTLINSIIYNFKSAALAISDQATWVSHCSAIPAGPALFCSPTSTGVTSPITTGNVFVARSRPNPFRDEVSFSFTLPESGPVSVEIFSADGRHIDTVARGDMAAGSHTLTWSMKPGTPSGLYFYRVSAGNHQSTGKITRVD